VLSSQLHLDLVLVFIVTSGGSGRLCLLPRKSPFDLLLSVPLEQFLPCNNGLLVHQYTLLYEHEDGVDEEHEQDQTNIVPSRCKLLPWVQYVVIREQVAGFELRQEHDFIEDFNPVQLAVTEWAVVQNVRNPPDREVHLQGKLQNRLSLDHCDAEHDGKSTEEEEGVVETSTQRAWSEHRVDFSPPLLRLLILEHIIFEDVRHLHKHNDRACNYNYGEQNCQTCRLEVREVTEAHLN